jgi:hypothetical protein
MTLAELSEFMTLMRWNRTMLAAQIQLTSAAVDKWFRLGEMPQGPASILLKDWLLRARRGLPLRAEEETAQASA